MALLVSLTSDLERNLTTKFLLVFFKILHESGIKAVQTFYWHLIYCLLHILTIIFSKHSQFKEFDRQSSRMMKNIYRAVGPPLSVIRIEKFIQKYFKYQKVKHDLLICFCKELPILNCNLVWGEITQYKKPIIIFFEVVFSDYMAW